MNLITRGLGGSASSLIKQGFGTILSNIIHKYVSTFTQQVKRISYFWK